MGISNGTMSIGHPAMFCHLLESDSLLLFA